MTQKEKQHIIMQIGEYCTTTKCTKCPIYYSEYHNQLHNNCVECLRFPSIAKAMAQQIKGLRLNSWLYDEDEGKDDNNT